jgi:hypothetical protein
LAFYIDTTKMAMIFSIVSYKSRNVSFICECWNQRAVKAEDSPNKPETFKQTSAIKLMAPVSWKGKEWWWWDYCNKGKQ